MIYQGGCHCGAVRFEIDAPAEILCEECNCSICSKSGFLHLILPISQFRLLKGENDLVTYTFNTGTAQHLFCRICGVKSYYVPRSNPDGIDVNVRCLDLPPRGIEVRQFDGRNWEDHAGGLAHLSRETD
jgi:hypothetical protein